MHGAQVRSLVGELRSHMLHGKVLKKLKKQKCKTTCDFPGQRPSGRVQWAQWRGDCFGWLLRSCFLVTKSCPTFCDPTDCRMPGFPVLHRLPEFAQIHVPWVGDATQSSWTDAEALLPTSYTSPALNLSQLQGLFQWVGSLQQVAKYWSFSFSLRGELDHFYNKKIERGT